MKKIVIFFVLLFITTAFLIGPWATSVPAGFTDLFIFKLESFSDSADTMFAQLDFYRDFQNELSDLQQKLDKISTAPTDFDGALALVEFFLTAIFDVLLIPVYLLGYVFVFVINVITLFFKFFDFLTIFST